MAFADWTQYKNGSWTVQLDTVSPLVGTGSIQIDKGSNGAINLVDSTNYTPGLTRGKIRTLFQVDTVTGGSDIRLGGIVFMQDQLDVSTTGTCYYVCMYGRVNYDIHVFRCNGSGISGTATILYNGATKTTVNGNLIGLEVEWVSEPTLLNATRIIVRYGTASDFNDLAEETTLLDPHDASGLTSSVGEGIGCVHNVSGVLTGARFDQTTISSLA